MIKKHVNQAFGHSTDPLASSKTTSLTELYNSNATAVPLSSQQLNSALLSKHDSNNVEIKINVPVADPELVYGLEIAVFFPKNIRPNVNTKQEIWSDFDSRVRLQVERTHHSDLTLNPDSRFQRLQEIQNSMNEVRRLCFSPSEAEVMTKEIQTLGYLITDWFQQFFGYQIKALFFIYSLLNTKIDPFGNFQEIHNDLQKMSEQLVDIHALCEQLRSREINLAKSLAEYVHFNLIKRISTTRSEFDRFKEIAKRRGKDLSKDFSRGQNLLTKALDNLQLEEAKYLYSTSLLNPPKSERDQEEYIIRIGNLKKFFQSPSFVSISKRDGFKKFTEAIATASALLAGAIGAAFQQVSESGVSRFGTGGFGLIAIAIILYAFRDRFKDWGKTFLAKKVFSKIPEFEENLSFQGVPLGTAKKWLSITHINKLHYHTECVDAKNSANVSKQNISEECVLFREEIAPIGKQQDLHLHHIIRINLRRYQRFLDDSEKTLTFLNEKGGLQTKAVQKFYPFIFSLHQSQLAGTRVVARTPHLYRVLMSKNGIERVEAIATE